MIKTLLSDANHELWCVVNTQLPSRSTIRPKTSLSSGKQFQHTKNSGVFTRHQLHDCIKNPMVPSKMCTKLKSCQKERAKRRRHQRRTVVTGLVKNSLMNLPVLAPMQKPQAKKTPSSATGTSVPLSVQESCDGKTKA
jgi:hypothetical protein